MMPDGCNVSTSSTSTQVDYGASLSSWMSHAVSLGAGHNTGVTIGGGEGDGVMVSSTDSELMSRTGGSGGGGNCNIGGNSGYLGTLPTTSKSPLLSAVIVSQQQTLGHAPFTASMPPVHLPPTVSSSGMASSSAGTPLLQTTTALPFSTVEVCDMKYERHVHSLSLDIPECLGLAIECPRQVALECPNLDGQYIYY